MSVKRKLYLKYAVFGLLSALPAGIIGLIAAHYSDHPVFLTVFVLAVVLLSPLIVLLMFRGRISLCADLLEKSVTVSGCEPEKSSVENALRNLYLRQLEIRDREEERNQIDRARLIERLLGDNRHTLSFADAQEHLQKMVKQEVLHMPYSGFCLLCLHIDDYDRIFDRRGQTNVPLKEYVNIRATIEETLRACAPESIRLYCVEYQGIYTCLINLETDSGNDTAEILRDVLPFCMHAMLRLDEEYDITAISALSDPFFDVADSHDAFRQCIGLFRFAGKLSIEKPVVSMLDIPPENPESTARQKQLAKKYVHATATLDMAKARDLLLEMIEPKLITSIQTAETINSTVLFYLAMAFDAIGCSMDKNPEINALCRQISSARSLDEMSILVQQVFTGIDVVNHPEGKKENKADQLRQYIDENYMDPELNLTILSDRFSMNASYVARIFKEATGQSVLVYLQNQRLSSAKNLLKTTDLNLTDIAARTGYASGWTMTRAFKRSEGITPGAYRQMAHNSDSSDTE